MSSPHFRLRIRNASQIVTVCSNGELFKTGKDQGEISILENASIVINDEGLIEDLGPSEEMEKKFQGATFDQDIDGTGCSIVPGLVDGHTHPVWSGDRVHEFAMKLAGATYLEVHQAGGGIGFTVNHTRDSSEKELEDLLLARLDRMVSHGTTLVEAKSGYGLNTETEMKMLKVLHSASKKHPIEISSTYLGAHSIPKGMTADQATEDILNNQFPELKRLQEAGEISVDAVDVFHEKGIYEHKQTRQILKAGKDLGLNINFHGDELNPMESGELGRELGALAISHLEKLTPQGILEMAKGPTFGVLLPTTAYILRLEVPPARDMISAGVPVALGSDFNPNAHCMSMPFVMHLACVNMRMTMNEALVAATINSAGSLGKSSTHGSLEKGKVGDLLIVGSPKWEHLIYQLVDPPIKSVIKRGNIIRAST